VYFGVELYPEFTAKAAVLCARLVRNHPLPDGNKRSAYLSLREFVARNGYHWNPPTDDETVSVMEALAAGEMSERDFKSWLDDGRISRP